MQPDGGGASAAQAAPAAAATAASSTTVGGLKPLAGGRPTLVKRGAQRGAMGTAAAASTGIAAAAGGPKKRMVIKPFKVQPKLPENFEDATWEKLRRAIVAVQGKEALAGVSREELYSAVEDLCVHKMGARLYERLKGECARHVAQAVGGLVAHQSLDQALFLARVDDVWQDHCEHMLTIRSIFLYLDRSHVLQTPGLQPIWEMGLGLFRLQLAQQGQQEGLGLGAGVGVEARVIRGLLDLVERQRNGESVNVSLLRSLVRMLASLGLYKPTFLRAFLEDTGRYFGAEGERRMETLDVVGFLRHVEGRLLQAQEAVVQYLEPGTRRPLMQTIEAQLLAPHVTALIEKGFEPLMDDNRVEDLQLMAGLCLRKPGGAEELKAAFNAYIRKRGAELVQDEARDKEMIDGLLAFKARCDAVLERAFGRGDMFVHALKDGFEHAVNVRQNRPAELLAKFLDAKLREKGTSEAEVEALLDRVMVIFRYVGSKDVFEAFYKKDLAKRLLLERSASADMEKAMIAKLKAECGATFTNKLEGMFKDMDLSKELMASYKQYQEGLARQQAALGGAAAAGGAREIEVTVQVLTTGYWPAYPPMEVAVPPVLEPYMSRFMEYYVAKFQGRRVTWQHSLGTCVVKARFAKGVKELSVSLFQTLVLLCFNATSGAADAGPVPFAEIKARTCIEDGELRRTLQSLACARVDQRVLRKEPAGREVEDGDVFHVNTDFTHKLYRVRINTIQLKETVEEAEKTHADVARDRQYQIDAAIVRIMKARKTLAHNLLISELLGQLKFPAKPVDLKKRIESLIERDYMARDATNPSLYVYVA